MSHKGKYSIVEYHYKTKDIFSDELIDLTGFKFFNGEITNEQAFKHFKKERGVDLIDSKIKIYENTDFDRSNFLNYVNKKSKKYYGSPIKDKKSLIFSFTKTGTKFTINEFEIYLQNGERIFVELRNNQISIYQK